MRYMASMAERVPHLESAPISVFRTVAPRARSEEARLLEENRAKDATIKALADALERLWNFSVPRAKTEALWPMVEAALRLAGRM